MPTLTWVGKNKVINHHHEVPFRVLKAEKTFRAPEGIPANSSDNRIIHGDNLEALKSLLPEFEGRVKCIYIDPPYNTGNEGWVYNDAVNDPKIKKWLGQVVGKEGEDLSRHDKWLCMMYPRLKLLRRLLSDDGLLYVSLDDVEIASFRMILDEIFGTSNFVGQLVWKSKSGGANDSRHMAIDHEYILCYAKSIPNLSIHADKEATVTTQYNLRDETGEYALERLDKQSLGYQESLDFPIEGPDGTVYRVEHKNPSQKVARWRWGKETVSARHHELVFKDGYVYTKNYRKEGAIPRSLLTEDRFGRTRSGKTELAEIMGRQVFDNPKPSKLIQFLLSIATKPGDLVLDSFAGSGTTGHAVLKLNAQDGGDRRFILIEMMDYADTITAERVRRVMTGYGEGTRRVEGLGGGFDYYTVGEPLFLPDDNLNEAVGTQAIRNYVAYSEGIPEEERVGPDNPHTPYLLGLNRETAWIFYHEPDRATSLDLDFLSTLRFGGSTGAPKPAMAIVYADRCLLSKDFMTRHRIVFKKIPRDITRF